MPLKITKATDLILVNQLVVCLYGPPGLGKTSTAFTADKPLLLDFDKGSYRAKNRGDVVQITSWPDVVDITADDLKAYKTVVVDTAGRALDVLATQVAALDPKNRRKDGALSQQGYGALKSTFTTWTKMVRSFGLDVVLVCHSEEQKDGDEFKERLDVTGGSKSEIYKSSDVMGRVSMFNGQRMLNLSPSDAAFGKNPGQLPPLEIPDYSASEGFLAGVIAQTKAAINALTAAQQAASAALGEWQARIGAAAAPADFTALIEPAQASDESVRDNVKRMLMKVAKERGLTFDVKERRFVAVDGKDAKPTAPEEKKPEAPATQGTTTVVGSVAEAVEVAAQLSKDQAPREPGDDSETEEAANRKAAEPSQVEVAKLDAEKTRRKGKAA